MKQQVVHIVDDASWGGVNRLLDCLTGNAGQASDQHKIVRLARGLSKSPLIEADVIVSHMSVCWKNLPFFSSLRATHAETPLIHVEHSYSEHFATLKVKQKDRFDDLMNMAYCMFDKIVAVSEPQGAWIARKAYCQPDQLVVIPSCVSLAPFFKVAGKRPAGAFKLGCIGRFHEQKGFDILIEAFVAANPPNMQLLVVGDGDQRAKLIEKAAGNPNIIFMGVTDHPAEAMAQCDAIAMPSRWEPYGLVALEAMAAGRNVICARVDGLLQHVNNGAIGVASNTVEGWRNVLAGEGLRVTSAAPTANAFVKQAEAQFINAWNILLHKLREEVLQHQKAA